MTPDVSWIDTKKALLRERRLKKRLDYLVAQGRHEILETAKDIVARSLVAQNAKIDSENRKSI